MQLANIPRHSLTLGPSPIHPLPRLSTAFGSDVEIWAKREDSNSEIAFGGNKVRKPEYLVAIHLTARTGGILTDPVYEGPSMAGLIGTIRSGEIPAG
jgi:1-aminocyclopropane-1-carboxylate deaminase/D-cysteine desulfhydrase-like pyridoxal-dependent ACC family enzyme